MGSKVGRRSSCLDKRTLVQAGLVAYRRGRQPVRAGQVIHLAHWMNVSFLSIAPPIYAPTYQAAVLLFSSCLCHSSARHTIDTLQIPPNPRRFTIESHPHRARTRKRHKQRAIQEVLERYLGQKSFLRLLHIYTTKQCHSWPRIRGAWDGLARFTSRSVLHVAAQARGE